MTSNNNKASTTQLVLASIAIVGVTTGLVLLWRGKKKRPTVRRVGSSVSTFAEAVSMGTRQPLLWVGDPSLRKGPGGGSTFPFFWMGTVSQGGTVIGHVSALNIHPIKSCGGVKVEAGEVEARGFRFDRLWMVVDAAGNFCTQRTVPKMAKVRPSLPASLSDVSGSRGSK